MKTGFPTSLYAFSDRRATRAPVHGKAHLNDKGRQYGLALQPAVRVCTNRKALGQNDPYPDCPGGRSIFLEARALFIRAGKTQLNCLMLAGAGTTCN